MTTFKEKLNYANTKFNTDQNVGEILGMVNRVLRDDPSVAAGFIPREEPMRELTLKEKLKIVAAIQTQNEFSNQQKFVKTEGQGKVDPWLARVRDGVLGDIFDSGPEDADKFRVIKAGVQLQRLGWVADDINKHNGE
jgi:hypothetical protein